MEKLRSQVAGKALCVENIWRKMSDERWSSHLQLFRYIRVTLRTGVASDHATAGFVFPFLLATSCKVSVDT